jgi:hypothetical protein
MNSDFLDIFRINGINVRRFFGQKSKLECVYLAFLSVFFLIWALSLKIMAIYRSGLKKISLKNGKIKCKFSERDNVSQMEIFLVN